MKYMNIEYRFVGSNFVCLQYLPPNSSGLNTDSVSLFSQNFCNKQNLLNLCIR